MDIYIHTLWVYLIVNNFILSTTTMCTFLCDVAQSVCQHIRTFYKFEYLTIKMTWAYITHIHNNFNNKFRYCPIIVMVTVSLCPRWYFLLSPGQRKFLNFKHCLLQEMLLWLFPYVKKYKACFVHAESFDVYCLLFSHWGNCSHPVML